MSEMTREEIWEAGELEVVIDDYGFCGEGFLRLADGWLSVPGALPGERVRVKIQEGQHPKTRRIFADVVEILRSSEHRRDPLCARDSVCRGCQLRHLKVAEELRFKVRTVREVIARYAELSEEDQPPVEVVTPQPITRGDAFRIRSRLSYRVAGDEVELGLYSPRQASLVSMEDCPALTVSVQRLIATIKESLREQPEVPAPQLLQGISVACPTHGVGLVDLELDPDLSQEDFEAALEGAVIGGWASALAGEVAEQVGVAVSSGERRRIIKEPTRIRIPLGLWNLEVGHDDWFHATPEPAEAVYRQMLEWLDLNEDDELIDVGCGIGTITLLAARQARQVVGLDRNSSSIESAQLNAMAVGAENADFVIGGWEKGLRQLAMEGRRFSAATINPMREPLGHKPLAFLRALGVERVVYLGPSPEAAAKDIGELRQMGWSVERLAAGNLHPATYHTLLMALVVRD